LSLWPGEDNFPNQAGTDGDHCLREPASINFSKPNYGDYREEVCSGRFCRAFGSTAYARCISCEAHLAPPRDDIIAEQQTSLSPP
jgi:hypothetical protein